MNLSDILSKLVSFYPVSSQQGRVLELLKYVEKQLAECGLDNEIIENNGVYMLYAGTQQNKSPKLLLQAHVDVVPAEEPLRQATLGVDNTIHGRGVRDMLFAAAAYIKFCHDNKDELHKLDVGILLNGDEEIGGFNTIPHALDLGYKADVVFLPDAGSHLDTIVASAKGVFNFDIIVDGIAHHGSRPWEGDGAASKLARLLTKILDLFPEPNNETTTCTVAELEAGDSTNKGPSRARAHLDIRYISKDDLLKYKGLIEDLCKKYQGYLSSVVIEPNYSVNTEHKLVKKYMHINEGITGVPVKAVSVSGSSDARYFSEKSMPVVIARPLSGGSHADDEWLDLESFNQFYNIMQQYILEVATIGGIDE